MPEKEAIETEQDIAPAHLKRKRGESAQMKKHCEGIEESLAEQLRGGEQSAAAEFVDRYYERIYLFMRGLGHDRQISEDLTQETFYQAWSHIGQLRDSKALNAWLYRIASNVSRLYWRKHKGKQPVSIDDIFVPQGPNIRRDDVAHEEELGRLKDAIARLPWKLRQAVVLHYMQHMTITEAAEAAGVKQGTFKSRLNRALTFLRKEIA